MLARRRVLAALALGGLYAPLRALAQRGKPWRIGFLVAATSPEAFRAGGRHDAFLKGMRELGYVEGKNFVLDLRFGEGRYERLSEMAANLAELKVDVIVATASPAIRAAQRATRTIPIIMVATGDPVGAGFVASLARPGGNITGLTAGAVAVSEKYVELLTSAVPRLSGFGVLANPNSSSYAGFQDQLASAAQKLGLKLVRADIRSPRDIESAFAFLGQQRLEGLIVVHEALILANRRHIAELAAKYRMPAVYGTRDYIEAGGLMSYGTDISENYRRAAAYVDRIFKGATPGDLPVEQPTKFELVINLKAAQALSLAIPRELLVRADELVQ